MKTFKFFVAALTALIVAQSALWAQSNVPPTLSLSADGQVRLELYRGRPLLLRVEVFNEQLMLNPSGTNTQAIGSSTNPWPNTISLEFIGPGGTPLIVPLQPANSPTGALTLTAQTGGECGWWIAPQHTAGLPIGTCQVRAVLNTTSSPSGWQGIAQSRAVELIVMNEPAGLPPELASEKALRLADYTIWQGNLAGAHTILDSLLASQATNVAALMLKGDLLASSGQHGPAFDFYQFALQAYYLRHPGAEAEPPAALLRRQKKLLMKVAFMPPTPYVPVKAFLAASNQITLQWSATVGQTYKIESTTNLKTWSIENASLTAGSANQTWTTGRTGTMRLFRVSQNQ